MTTLDNHFAQLRDAAIPAGLDMIEQRVFDGIAVQRESAVARRGLVLAGTMALAIGISGSLIPVNEARAEPLLGIPAAAPSRLLGL